MKAGRYQLFNEDSVTVHSPIFTITPDTTAVIHAYGFKMYVDEDITLQPKRRQQAILQQVVLDVGEYPEETFYCGTNDLSSLYPEGMLYEDVTGCGAVCITSCTNRRMLDIPGTYRLELNDDSYVGDVKIFLDIYYKDDTKVPPHATYLGE